MTVRTQHIHLNYRISPEYVLFNMKEELFMNMNIHNFYRFSLHFKNVQINLLLFIYVHS